MSFRFVREALEDFAEAARYYQSLEAELATRFVVETYAAIDYAIRFPELGRRHATGFRKRRVKHFPYDIVFKNFDGVIVIAAVSHHRKHPDGWLDRTH